MSVNMIMAIFITLNIAVNLLVMFAMMHDAKNLPPTAKEQKEAGKKYAEIDDFLGDGIEK